MYHRSMEEYLFAPPGPWPWSPSGDRDLWTAILESPAQPWNFYRLSEHPELSWSFVERTIHRSWNWDVLSRREDLDFAVVARHPDKDWNWKVLSEHPAVTLDDIRAHPSHFWFFTRRHVPLDLLVRCPMYGRNYRACSRSLPLSVILAHPAEDWDWGAVTARADLPPEVFEQHPDLPWDWRNVPVTPRLLELVQRYPDRAWNWNKIAMLPHLPHDFVRTCALHLQMTGRLRHIVASLGYWDLVPPLAGLGARVWNWNRLGMLVPWFVLAACVDQPWPWRKISNRRDLVWTFVATHAHLDWNWQVLSAHPTLTAAFVADHRWLPWRYATVRSRHMVPEELAARQIQRWWLRLYYNPASNVCRARLLRDCAALNAMTCQGRYTA